MQIREHFFKIICLCIALPFQVSSSGPAQATWIGGWKGWIENTAPNDASVYPEMKTIIADVYSNLGLTAAAALGAIQRGARLGSPNNQNAMYYGSAGQANFYLTTAWLGQFASILTGNLPPYMDMTPFNISTAQGLSSIDKNYITNHLAPALATLGAAAPSSVDLGSFSSSIEFTPGSFNGVLITTINNNTQQTFSVLQNNIQIATISPGANSVALYGAAQAKGDLIFLPQAGSSGSFRVSFKQGSDVISIANTTAITPYTIGQDGVPNAADNFMCVQITRDDFPASMSSVLSEIMPMIQRTECINLSQLTGSAYITLQIEDNTAGFNEGRLITLSQKSAIKEGSNGSIPISMYYPSIQSMQLFSNSATILPFLALPSSLALQPYVSAWINFINIVVGAIYTNYSGNLYTPTYISAIKEQSLNVFIVKKSGDAFGDVSRAISLQPGFSASDDVERYSFPAAQPINLYGLYQSPAMRPMPISYMYAGLPGTTTFITGDISDQNMLYLYAQLYNQVSRQYPGIAMVNFSKSVTITNLYPVVQKNIATIWQSISERTMQLKVQFAGISKNNEALYTFVVPSQQQFVNLVDTFLPADGLILEAFASSMNSIEIPVVHNPSQKISFSMKDVAACLAAVSSGDKKAQTMPSADGLWGYIQTMYRLSAQPEARLQGVTDELFLIQSEKESELIRYLQKNPALVKGLLATQQVKIPLQTSGAFLNFNSIDVLRLLFNMRGLGLSDNGTIMTHSSHKVQGIQVAPVVIPKKQHAKTSTKSAKTEKKEKRKNKKKHSASGN